MLNNKSTHLYFLAIALILLSFQLPLTAASSDSSLVWLNDVEQAQQQAKEQNKTIVVYFSGSDWCRPCMQLSADVFKSEIFRTTAPEKFILVQLDFPARKKNQLSAEQRSYNEKMAEKYDPKGQYPLVVLLNSDGSVIAEFSGYRREGASAYIEKLYSYLKQDE